MARHHRKYLLFFLFIILNFVLLFNHSVQAIPAFARKYGVSCTTCHASIPKLHGFGEAFRNNGYRFPKETKNLLREEPVPLGGKPQEKLWPKDAIWPGEIPGTIPLAIRVEADFHIDPGSEVKSDFRLPYEIELLSGGSLGKNVSFFVELELFNDQEPGEIERAFLQFDRILGFKMLNVKIGQVEPIAVPFSHFRKITMAAYPTSAFRNGADAFSFQDRQRGVELWGMKDGTNSGGLLYGFGIVNGNGDGKKSAPGTFDNNSAKDFYGRISYKFGGLALSGEGGKLPYRNAWEDNSLRLGGFGYRGKAPESTFNRYGFDFRLQHGNLDFFGILMLGDNKFKPGNKLSFRAYFIEANYVFLPWVLGAVRYGEIHTPDDNAIPDKKEIMANISASVRPNIVMRIEGLKEITGYHPMRVHLRLDFAY